MELIPTLISLSGFGIAITFVTIAHKVITSGEQSIRQPAHNAKSQVLEAEQTAFIRKHAAAH